jgi:hypothetical protein
VEDINKVEVEIERECIPVSETVTESGTRK